MGDTNEQLDNLVNSLLTNQTEAKEKDAAVLAQLKILFCEAPPISVIPQLSTILNAPANTITAATSTIGSVATYAGSFLPSAHSLPLVGGYFTKPRTSQRERVERIPDPQPAAAPVKDPNLEQSLIEYFYSDPSNKTGTGMTLPPLAVLLMRHGCIESFKYLLQKNAISMDLQIDYDDSGKKIAWKNLNLLHYAIINAHAAFAEQILTYAAAQKKSLLAFNGTLKIDKYQPINPPMSVAHIAAMCCGSMDLFKLLQKNGADFNAEDGRGNRPLHLATMAGNTAGLKCLLDPSLKVATQDGSNPLRNNEHNDPLRIAILQRNTTLVPILCEAKLYSEVPHPFDQSGHYQLALMLDAPQQYEKTKNPAMAPLLKQLVKTGNISAISHKQMFFQRAYDECSVNLAYRLNLYPKRKGWERLIITHKSRKKYKQTLLNALNNPQIKSSNEYIIKIDGESATVPCANPEEAFTNLLKTVKEMRFTMQSENHFGIRGPAGSQMLTLVTASLAKFESLEKIGKYSEQHLDLYNHINGLLQLHISEYEAECKKRMFKRHSSRDAIIKTLQDAMKDTPAPTNSEETIKYLDKIRTDVSVCLGNITPRCCAWLRGTKSSSMYQHLHRLQDQLQVLAAVIDTSQPVDWVQVDKVGTQLQEIEHMQTMEKLAQEKRQAKAQTIRPKATAMQQLK